MHSCTAVQVSRKIVGTLGLYFNDSLGALKWLVHVHPVAKRLGSTACQQLPVSRGKYLLSILFIVQIRSFSRENVPAQIFDYRQLIINQHLGSCKRMISLDLHLCMAFYPLINLATLSC